MAKIYVVGAVGSGKTTFAKKLSEDLNIPYYELDEICWKPEGAGKRNPEEIESLFFEVLNCESWIIENIGSDFDKGFEEADTIIYLDISKSVVHRRIWWRAIKRSLGIEKSPFKNNIKNAKNEIEWSNKEIDKKRKLNKLQEYKEKLEVLNEKQVKKYKYNQRNRML